MKSWGDELARQVDLRIHAAVADLPGLDAIPLDDRADGMVCTVLADQSPWQFVIGSTAAASPTVRVPADKPAHGRWCLVAANLAGASQGPSTPGPAQVSPVKLAVTLAAAQFAGLAAGVKSTAVPLGAALPAGARPLVRELKLTAPFGGGGATTVTLDLGGSVPNDILAGQSLMAPAPSAMAGTAGVNPTGDHGGQQLNVTITSDIDLNKITTGAVAVTLFYVILP